MRGELPEFLKQGEPARLIPTCAASQKERAACSVLLAAMRVVHPFARDILGEMGKRVGSWASIDAYTEVVFERHAGDEKSRPDGLLILDTSRRQWKAIVEAKIGSARISPEQIRRYYRLAQANGIDAIITVSNELSACPDHIPYEVPPDVLGHIELYHLSWPYVGMLANMLLREEEGFDEEQHFILEEVVRYLDDQAIDVMVSIQMGADWQQLMQKILGDGHVTASDPDVLNAVKCWHQQQANICLWLGRELHRQVSLNLKRRDNQRARLLEDAAEFISNRRFCALFNVPTLAGPIELVANALVRNVTCRMSVAAPADLRRYQTRINWLLSQLPTESDKGAMVHISWDNRDKTSVPLDRLRKDRNCGRVDSALPIEFSIARSFDAATKFSGRQTFIDSVDSAIWRFYDGIARHIHPWQPAPIRESKADQDAEPPESTEDAGAASPERTAVKRGKVPGGSVTVFDDDSIELKTASGTRWFPNFAELENSLRASNGRETPAEETSLTPSRPMSGFLGEYQPDSPD